MVSMSGRSGLWGPVIAAMYGPPIIGVRLGMEDSSWMRPTDDEVIQDNVSIVKNFVDMLNLLGRRPATANEYREMLGIEKKYDK